MHNDFNCTIKLYLKLKILLVLVKSQCEKFQSKGYTVLLSTVIVQYTIWNKLWDQNIKSGECETFQCKLHVRDYQTNTSPKRMNCTLSELPLGLFFFFFLSRHSIFILLI